MTSGRRSAAKILLVTGYLNTFVAAIRGLVLIPVYITAFGPELYGYWVASGGVLAWLVAVDMGTATITIQQVSSAVAAGKRRDALDAYWTGVAVLTIQATLVILLGVGLSFALPNLFSVPAAWATKLQIAFGLSALNVALQIVSNVAVALPQGLQRPHVLAILRPSTGLLSILVTVLMLRRGAELISIPLGLIVGSSIMLLAATVQSVAIGHEWRMQPRVDVHRMRSTFRLSAFTFVAKLANAGAGRIEPTVIAAFGAPTIAAAYDVTKKAADLLKMFVDRIGAAGFSGLAHLNASDSTERTTLIFKRIVALGYGLAIVALSGYVLLARPFVDLWVGELQFAGSAVSVLIGAATCLSAMAGLLGYLLGAIGEIRESAIITALEAALRIVLIIVGYRAVGLVAVPGVVAITSYVSMMLFFWRYRMRWSGLGYRFVVTRVLAMLGLTACAFLISRGVSPSTWVRLVGTAFAWAITIGGVFFAIDKTLRDAVRRNT